MDKLHITYSPNQIEEQISFTLPPSKSLIARKLILAAIQNIPFENLGYSLHNSPEDILALHQALQDFLSGKEQINVLESGTAMRFMTAFIAASCKQTTHLSGTGRQHQRPITSLVDALRSLGADITYTEQEGYPPLTISPSNLIGQTIEVDASQSSQYLSALLLIAPLIQKGNYQITLKDNLLSSAPYAQMTIEAMREVGFIWQQNNDTFSYFSNSQARCSCSVGVEADWTAASYAYLLLSLLHDSIVGYTAELHLPMLYTSSNQGDSQLLPQIYHKLGVQTKGKHEETVLSLIKLPNTESIEIDCRDTPDLVPSLVASLVAQSIPFTITGVAHLRIKESDRLAVIAQELAKVGIMITVADSSLSWLGEQQQIVFDSPTLLNPHNDHRIAMALAPLITKLNPYGVIVEQASCVKKSFPTYWRELKKLGYNINNI